jgi:DNA polymerase-3 subunit epsilon
MVRDLRAISGLPAPRNVRRLAYPDRVAGTLSLFDWRPAPEPSGAPSAEPSAELAVDHALGSGPVLVALPERPERPERPALLATDGARIVIFDCETTGTDRLQDQVIELCVQYGMADEAASQTWRIKPSVPIHPGAQAVHGIALADLDDCPPFGDVADAIARVFLEADVIVGYNVAFDFDMLQAEYTRVGKPLLDLAGKKIVDAFRLWQQCEPRSLQHAHQRFVGNGFASAHSASADVAATGRVLAGMLHAFNLAGDDWEAIANRCDPQRTATLAARASWLGPTRHLRWEGDVVVLGFGKYANAQLHDLAAGPDRSFLRWVIERDFPVHVGEICRAALDLPGDEFLAWARRRYPVSLDHGAGK